MFNSAIEYVLFLVSLEIATLFGSVVLILKTGGF
jgi:hypothetical protein